MLSPKENLTENLDSNSTQKNESIEIKVSFQGEYRRFVLPVPSFQLLNSTLSDLFEVENFVVQYKDPEGDFITISSDKELSYAANLFNKYLRLFVQTKDDFERIKHKRERIIERYLRKQERCSPRFGENRCMWPMRERHRCREQRISRKMLARFVSHVTIPDGTTLPPNTPFTKTWRFRNEGSESWDKGCQLMFIGKNSDQMSGPDFVEVKNSENVKPNDEIDVSVLLVSPEKPGRYVGFWRMRDSSGRKFGQRVWVKIDVIDPEKQNSVQDSVELK